MTLLNLCLFLVTVSFVQTQDNFQWPPSADLKGKFANDPLSLLGRYLVINLNIVKYTFNVK